MGEQIYRLLLDDQSLPAYCSFDKHYFGTIEMVEGFINAIRNDKKIAAHYKNLISYFDEFKRVPHKEGQFLIQAKCVAERKNILTNYEWEHLNVWNWPYNMKCEIADCSHVWIVCQRKFMRCVKVNFTKLKYGVPNAQWQYPGMLWGYPHQIETENNRTYSRLFCVEKQFKNKSELLEDIELFESFPDPNFQEVLSDIFGDG